MAITSNAPEAQERVLSTLNRDGTRRWIRPKVPHGRYYRRRLITAWSLIITDATQNANGYYRMGVTFSPPDTVYYRVRFHAPGYTDTEKIVRFPQ